MDCKIDIIPRVPHLKQPVGTSRGTYITRKVWYLHFVIPEFPNWVGIEGCAPPPNLSCDDLPDYEEVLAKICRQVENRGGELDMEALCKYPSILFGLETAIRHFSEGSWALWNMPSSCGGAGILINGLIWMSDFNRMLAQVEKEVETEFHCIKLKIGVINFEEELALPQHIRSHYSSKEIESCVDANGASSPTDVTEKLKHLSELDSHSIEQPIRAEQWEEMAHFTSESPLLIALDEELIGCNTWEEKQRLFSAICPQYIITKPSLRGGLAGGEEWIIEAEELNIGWRITSALESSTGLSAVAQWCATFQNPLPQGLDTRSLFTDSVGMPLEIRRDYLWFCR